MVAEEEDKVGILYLMTEQIISIEAVFFVCPSSRSQITEENLTENCVQCSRLETSEVLAQFRPVQEE